MVQIPLVPDHIADRIAQYGRGTLFDTLWKLFVSVVFALILYVALSSPIGFVSTLAGIAAGYLLADDVGAVINDIWHRDFYTVGD
jgi:hypothetical protein